MTTEESTSTKTTSADLLQRIEHGIEAFTSSEEFQKYLAFVGRFHSYSLYNTLLILMQRPDASRVAGYRKWQELGRQVLKGEKSIQILAPMFAKRDEQDDDEDGRLIGFRVARVFDVAQTEGEPLPEAPIAQLQGGDKGLVVRLLNVLLGQGLTLDTTPDQHPTANGFYVRSEKRIWLSSKLQSAAMQSKTLAHELAHHFAEHEENAHTRPEAETIAEAVACIVLNHFGIDSATYSFGYLATWGSGDAKLFKAKLNEILKTAQTIIELAEAAPTPELPPETEAQAVAEAEAIVKPKRTRKAKVQREPVTPAPEPEPVVEPEPEAKEPPLHFVDGYARPQLSKLSWITDPGHGWLKVPLTAAYKVPEISRYSYEDKHHAYLEEDVDAGRFIAHWGYEAEAIRNLPTRHYEDNCPVRRKNRYMPEIRQAVAEGKTINLSTMTVVEEPATKATKATKAKMPDVLPGIVYHDDGSATISIDSQVHPGGYFTWTRPGPATLATREHNDKYAKAARTYVTKARKLREADEAEMARTGRRPALNLLAISVPNQKCSKCGHNLPVDRLDVKDAVTGYKRPEGWPIIRKCSNRHCGE